MTQTSVSGWKVDSERGPGDWLIVRLHPPQNGENGDFCLDDAVWELAQLCFTNKVVLEMGEVQRLNSPLIGQLVRLQKRVGSNHGLLRLVNLSPNGKRALDVSRLSMMLPSYGDRYEAVMGRCAPRQPR